MDIGGYEHFLDDALILAQFAYQHGEVPVGAIVAQNNQIISQAYNQKESLGDPTAHAEILAIRQAADKLGNWRLTNCVLISTLEPCPMCMGAILQSRISAILYGAKDSRWGACGSILNIGESHSFNHRTDSYYVERKESVQLLKQFFKERRLSQRR